MSKQQNLNQPTNHQNPNVPKKKNKKNKPTSKVSFITERYSSRIHICT